jgi:fimbrial chaperone protein
MHKSKNGPKRWIPWILTVATCTILPAVAAQAAAFRVTPISVHLSSSSSSAVMTLTNESQDTLRFQISAFEWTQTPTEQIKLTPTTDIVFFPSLLTLAARQERKVRVGSVVAPGGSEKTYRIFFEELPPLKKPAEPQVSQVRILTKMGIPIFLQPTGKGVALGAIENLSAKDGKVSFAVKNSGNVHFSTQAIHVLGIGEGGKSLFDKQAEAWYVLSGVAREYQVEIPKDACADLKSVEIQALTDISTVKESSTLKRRADVTAPCK